MSQCKRAITERVFPARVLSEEGYLYQHNNPYGSLASNWQSWLVDEKADLQYADKFNSLKQ